MKSLRPKIFVLLALIAFAASSSACRSSGSREFKPGKGWVPN